MLWRILRALALSFVPRQWIFRFRRRTPNPYHPVILITGCGSGLGLALSKLLANHTDYRLALSARAHSIEDLRQEIPENDRIRYFAMDLTDELDRIKTCAEIKRLWGGVDVLINNAGISYRAVVEHMSETDEHLQMDTNYFGPMGLIRLTIEHMREKGRGKIINVSSVSGMLAMPTMASYSASKHALEGASESLWYEMRPLGISVSLIQPGFINSTSFYNVHRTEAALHAEAAIDAPYADYYRHMSPFIELMMKNAITTPEDIAVKILKVIQTENPPLWIPATHDAVFFYYLRRLLPRRWLLPFLYECLPHSDQWGRGYSKKRH